MNPSVLSSARASAVTEHCPVLSLSAVLSDYWGAKLSADATTCPGSAVANPGNARSKRTASAAFDVIAPAPLLPPPPPPLFPRIALLKVDVEGDELAVLQSLSAEHWACVERVILEAAPHLEQEIVDFLCSVGFVKESIETDRGHSSGADYTGNLIIFATRNRRG